MSGWSVNDQIQPHVAKDEGCGEGVEEHVQDKQIHELNRCQHEDVKQERDLDNVGVRKRHSWDIHNNEINTRKKNKN